MTEAAVALIELLERPDEDGCLRAHRLTHQGDEDRMDTIWPELARAYLSHRVAEHCDYSAKGIECRRGM